ncbi:MAG: hypothetical protein AVDCRST_MAG78-1085 [uncultured Rubrobacteraceae bacterium]|uniref:Uncharacterized protein n=1 Tax=uncultured Rubrobacteraceae bacterium TaxID=349277 RepID=A0A6J4PQM8_9ACTN|nr:MAG: hypothetical protein AVDCRST_MAG78-1085 [uncultured Rubrobacteraceae bacterium]
MFDKEDAMTSDESGAPTAVPADMLEGLEVVSSFDLA